MSNPIQFDIPRLLYDECFLISDNNTTLFKKLIKGEDSAFCEVGIETHMKFFNIFNTYNMHCEIFKNEKPSKTSSLFSILRLMTKGNKWSLGELSYLCVADQLIKQIALMHFYHDKYHRRVYNNIINNESDLINLKHQETNISYNADIDINIVDFINRD